MRTTRWLIALAAAVTVTVAVFAHSAPVFAHAAYDHSTPARDEVVTQAPARVDVWFKQEVFRQQGSNFVRVFDDSQTQVSQGDGVVDDNDRKHISTDLPAGLANGRYIVRWMTLSDADGDTANGAFCFYVGVQPTAAQQAECTALAGGEETPTPTPVATAPAPSPTAGGGGGSGGGGVPAVAVVISVIAVAAVLVVGAGVVAVRRRRTLG